MNPDKEPDMREVLLTDMRCQVECSHVATMPIPLYERMKAAINATSELETALQELGQRYFNMTKLADKALIAKSTLPATIQGDIAVVREALEECVSALDYYNQTQDTAFDKAKETLTRLMAYVEYLTEHLKRDLLEYLAKELIKKEKQLRGIQPKGQNDE